MKKATQHQSLLYSYLLFCRLESEETVNNAIPSWAAEVTKQGAESFFRAYLKKSKQPLTAQRLQNILLLTEASAYKSRKSAGVL